MQVIIYQDLRAHSCGADDVLPGDTDQFQVALGVSVGHVADFAAPDGTNGNRRVQKINQRFGELLWASGCGCSAHGSAQPLFIGQLLQQIVIVRGRVAAQSVALSGLLVQVYYAPLIIKQ